jgi:RHS repeat-associated protein
MVGGATIAVRSNASGTEKVHYLSGDHHGTSTVSISSDSTQTLSKRYTTPFGTTRGSAVGTWPDDKSFLGKSADSSTGLTQVGAREYDASTGQFLSVDPLLMPDQHQSLNGYSYANNNPTTLSDPSGLGVCMPEVGCGGVNSVQEAYKEYAETQSACGTSCVAKNGRSGSAPEGAPRYSRSIEEMFFTNQQIAAMLRKERVNQILDGAWDLSNPWKEMAEKVEDSARCLGGAREGCTGAKLGEALTDLFGADHEDAAEIMARIDESWKAKGTHKKVGEFAFDHDEFQIALTLAITGKSVMSRNDRQPNPHRGDAWVDDKRADFKAMKSRRADGLRDHLKKADVHQQVEIAVIDLRPGGMEEKDARDGLRWFRNSTSRGNIQRVIVFGRGYAIDYDDL